MKEIDRVLLLKSLSNFMSPWGFMDVKQSTIINIALVRLYKK